MTKLDFIVTAEQTGERIDRFLSAQDTGLTRSAVQKLIEDGGVTVGGKKVSKNYKLRNGDSVEIIIPDPVELDVKPQDIPVEIVYEDSELLVVNKPKGMVVHPAAGNPDGTLVNALLYRIDKNTSGLLIVAKTDSAHNFLAAQIKEHSFTREYEAVLTGGRLKTPTGTVDAPIGRSKYDRKKMCVTEQNSKHAVTHYEVLEEFGQCSLVKFRLETGRTHQIRVHSAYIGHPVYGDDVYGKAVKGIEGQCLHAKKIGFIHPATKEYMEFDSELPDYFQAVLKKLRAGN